MNEELLKIELYGTWYILQQHGPNDYSITETDEPEDLNEGCSIRGTSQQLLENFKADVLKKTRFIEIIKILTT
jgi:hypothetical protein